jgi:folate-binding protein YgfZ
MSPPASLDAEVRAARAGVALASAEPYALAEIAGEDRREFLQNQFPADLAPLASGEGVYTAYLDRKGRITHDLLVLDLGDRFWILSPRDRLRSLLDKLEDHHFRERVTVEDRSAGLAVLELHGPGMVELLARAGGSPIPPRPFGHAELRVGGIPVRVVADPWTGAPGGHLVLPRGDLARVEDALEEAGGETGIVRIGEDALEVLRIEGGRPRYGADMDEGTLLPELGMPGMVSYEKGCYLGQETVARVHARGHVNRLLLGLEIEGTAVPEPGTRVLRGDEPAGETRSACFSPTLGRAIAFAMLRVRIADAGTVVHLASPAGLVAATVRELPLYRTPGPKEEAAALYRRALEAFGADRFEEALALFERAALFDPSRLDAREGAGIAYERLGRMDDAKAAMESITDADPEHVMAWTNLSRYHAQEGNLEEAERIKGKVSALVWKREARERAAERRSQEDEASRRARLEARIGLFREVLAMDPDDLVANFGLGKLYLDLERFEEAIPRFEKAVERDPGYSAAYDHLGTALRSLGRNDRAAAVFRAGIEAATRKGDLIPKRSMSRKLAELDEGGPPASPAGDPPSA